MEWPQTIAEAAGLSSFFTFERPLFLLLLLLVIPLSLIGSRGVGGLPNTQATIALGLRVFVLCLLAVALARPAWQHRAQSVSTTVILDRSQSVPLQLRTEAIEMLAQAVERRTNAEDRIGVISVGRTARIVAIPGEGTGVFSEVEPDDAGATNLADGVRLALAMAPGDTANRLVLASDGNENVDFVLEVTALARANGVPIDVLPLAYAADREVIFEQLAAPARVRLGQTINLKMVLRSTSHAEGRIVLRQNGEMLDISGDAPGVSLPVSLNPGPNFVVIPRTLNQPGRQRFEAVFEPDDPADDLILGNNTGVAITFVAGEGRVLVIDETGMHSEPLIRALDGSDIASEVHAASAWSGLDFLAGYDAVVLANVPRWELTSDQERDLHTYVHDLGGGLIMLGGDTAFGAGGWIGSQLADALPVDLEPPHTRQTLRGALVLIIDASGSMAQPVAGTGMTQQQIANEAAILGIRSLTRLDQVTVIGFSGAPSLIVPLTARGDGEWIVEQVRSLAPGGGTNLFPALDLAAQQLAQSRAGTKHIVILTDGQTVGDPAEGLAKAAALAHAGVTISTIAIGDGADDTLLQTLAAAGHGRRHLVQSRGMQTTLPQILIHESRLVSRSLIQEGETFVTLTAPLGGPTLGFAQSPSVSGYVLTAPRGGIAQVPISIDTPEGRDPLFAFWNYGLGKSIAFTSELTGRWGTPWVTWDRLRAFWTQSIQWVMRPSSPSNITLQTTLNGDIATVELLAVTENNASFMNFLSTSAAIVDPESNVTALALAQVGPGRYRGEFTTASPGAYLVNVVYAAGESRGSVHAVVSVPYPREFADLQHNAALLHEVARRTGGRVLSLRDPLLPDLFLREQIEFPRSRREVWDLLTVIAAVFLVLDVACRRLSIDRDAVTAAVAGLVRRTPQSSSDAVAAWVNRRATAVTTVTAVTAVTAVPHQMQDQMQDTPRASELIAAEPALGPPARPQSPGEPIVSDPGEVASRLLEAKRRAQLRHDGQVNDGTTRD